MACSPEHHFGTEIAAVLDNTPYYSSLYYQASASRGGNPLNLIFDRYPQAAWNYDPFQDVALRRALETKRPEWDIDTVIEDVNHALLAWKADRSATGGLSFSEICAYLGAFFAGRVRRAGVEDMLAPDTGMPMGAGGGGGGSGPGRPRTPGDRLPTWQKGHPTRGVLDTGSEEIDLVSGSGGPADNMPLDTPGMRHDMTVRTHVEAHAAAIMRQRGLKEATLYINNTPCPGRLGCDNMLPHMLPEGTTLHVRVKVGNGQWDSRTYYGLPDADWRWPQ
jgi:hypothetical protein